MITLRHQVFKIKYNKKMTEDKNQSIIPDEIVMNKIYLIGGQKVMLDSDLADLYEVETRRLNEQGKGILTGSPKILCSS